MSPSKVYFAILCWVLILHIIGITWFTKGFLLKRLVIDRESECHTNFTMKLDPENSKGFSPGSSDDGHSDDCWQPRRFDRAIIIIIDALRFDFAYYNESILEDDTKPYQNKLLILKELLAEKHDNSKLYKFKADPPTTTLQRLKGMTTGSLPTFVDASSNFGSPEITEDNFLSQFIQRNKSIVFMGDDTWMDLYPQSFVRSFPFPSLNIMDLHTVDNGILQHLMPEIHKPDWEVLIAHFLGVDHCGHTYGPDHPAMAEKLTQMDQMLRTVISEMESDTILFVLGDHGMTRTGDHGGDSDDELDAALFVYSPTRITSSPGIKKEKYQKIWQVDLVPTISLLLGSPIPFSSLGALMSDLFTLPTFDGSENNGSPIQQVHRAVKSLQINALQVNRYLQEYISLLDEFPYVEFAELDLLLRQSNTHLLQLDGLLNIEGQEDEVLQRLRNLRKSYRRYLKGVKLMCQNVWARFDGSCMLLGGVTLGTGVILLIYLYIIVDPNSQHIPARLYTGVVGSAWQLLFSLFLYSVGLGVFGLVASITLGFPAIFISTHIIDRILVAKLESEPSNKMLPQKTSKIKKDWNFVDLFTLCCMLLYGGGMFSNSFVVYEDVVVPVLFASIICVMWHRTVKEMHKKSGASETGISNMSKKMTQWRFDLGRVLTSPVSLLAVLVVLLLTCLRLGANFRACREEQWTCELSEFLTTLSSLAETAGSYKNFRYFFPVCSLGVVVILVRKWLRYHGNLNGFSPMVLVSLYVTPLSAVCVCFHWALQALPQTIMQNIPIWQQILFARIVYGFFILTLITLLVRPLMIFLVPRTKSYAMPHIQDKSPEERIPHVYRHVKSNWKDYLVSRGSNGTSPGQGEATPPTVYGLATVYSAALLTWCVSLAVLLSMLLGDGMAPGVTLHLLSGLLLLEVTSAYILAKGQGTVCEDTPWCCVMLWCLLATTFFFNTGHQYSITHIRWESAYTGFHGNFDYYVIPAVLVTLNTFASHILAAFGMPLLLFWPLVNGRFIWRYSTGNQTSETRGEMIINENSMRLRNSLFSLIITAMLYYSFKFFCAMLATAALRRHLMVWKIFAPHFVFEGVTLLVVYVLFLAVYVLVLHIDHRVEGWLERLAKSS